MVSLKKENQVEDLDYQKKKRHWTWSGVFEFETLAIDFGILPSALDAEMMLELQHWINSQNAWINSQNVMKVIILYAKKRE